jgi:hypothetical protein
MTKISGQLALEITRGAFLPLHCGTEIYDYSEMMRIHVVNGSNQSMLKLSSITRDELTNSERLAALLHRLRDDISQLVDAHLEPWQMPDVKLLTTP